MELTDVLVILMFLTFIALLFTGFPIGFVLGAVAASGTLGILIPPSIMLVIMADQLNLSVGDLFMGAVIPGVIENLELVWFNVLLAVSLQTSFLTPPVGFAIFFLQGVVPSDVVLLDIYKGVVPFVILQLIGLAVVLLWPQLVIWLPAVAYG